MKTRLTVLAMFVFVVSIGAYEIKHVGFVSVNNGSNQFLVFHHKMKQQDYNLSTHSKQWKIMAFIDEPMPLGSKLLINALSEKGTSLGPVDLSDGIPKNVVVGYGNAVETNQHIFCTIESSERIGRKVTLLLKEW